MLYSCLFFKAVALSTITSAAAYDYQWFWERLSVLPPTITSAFVDVVVELAVKKRAVRSRSGH